MAVATNISAIIIDQNTTVSNFSPGLVSWSMHTIKYSCVSPLFYVQYRRYHCVEGLALQCFSLTLGAHAQRELQYLLYS